MEVTLSQGEYRLLKLMAERGFREGTLEEAAKILGVDKSSLASLSNLLAEKGLVEVEERVEEHYVLTERVGDALERGLPEEKLVLFLAGRGGEASVEEVRRALGEEAGIALGQAARKGLVVIAGGVVRLAVDQAEALKAITPLKKLLENVASGSKPTVGDELLREALSRGLIRREARRSIVLRVKVNPAEVLARARVEAAVLTRDMLKSGEWRRLRFKPYNVKAEPPRVLPARRHFLAEFIERLRDILRELGFREVRGPLVELELFNFDVLFQAQDHPAREIHDSLWIKSPRRGDLSGYSDLVERVASVHERGWKYRWSPEVASRYILRSQTTAVSARILATRPNPPARFFTVGKVFRSDAVGPTRLPEFHQLDGIEGDEGYTFRDLLGRLDEIASMLGLKLKFKPAYFPFTEPSVEGYVKLPNGKWLELFGAGMFRPEVLEAVGVNYPVGAWGFGIERLAMAFYGVSDIRKLYTRNVDEVREMRVRWL
ncbi:phenylalanine--tRNA ligase subunit alpha [Aeropyrum pernix]|nr:phenylalanine--tRNA ligase subunit alpha [Aeropyrum pernix]